MSTTYKPYFNKGSLNSTNTYKKLTTVRSSVSKDLHLVDRWVYKWKQQKLGAYPSLLLQSSKLHVFVALNYWIK